MIKISEKNPKNEHSKEHNKSKLSSMTHHDAGGGGAAKAGHVEPHQPLEAPGSPLAIQVGHAAVAEPPAGIFAELGAAFAVQGVIVLVFGGECGTVQAVPGARHGVPRRAARAGGRGKKER